MVVRPRAVIVGAGPNGLSAAVHLARHGVAVTVMEAQPTIGGGARSGELGIPGVIHDRCSAVHPLGAASPFFTSLDLAKHGLRWQLPEIDCAHPLDTGRGGVLYRSIEETAAALGPDGWRWRRLFGPVADRFDQLAPAVLGPFPRLPARPGALGVFAIRAAAPASALARVFTTERARALIAGVAAHPFVRLDRPLTSAAAIMLIAAGHRYGWPVARGGSQAISEALAAELRDCGGVIHTGTSVRTYAEIPPADLVLLDLTPAGALRLYGRRMPPRVRRAFTRFRYGATAFKVDFAIEGDVPWLDPDCRRAGTVHLGGELSEVAAAEHLRVLGAMPPKPFVLVGQQYLADPIRSSSDVNPLWVYTHVPQGFSGDATEAVIGRIEQFAPGFAQRIVATRSSGPADLEAHNENYVGGDISGGRNDGLQLLFRPRMAVDPYSLGIPGVYLCSQSTPPGAGVHGMCGYRAAESALRYLRERF